MTKRRDRLVRLLQDIEAEDAADDEPKDEHERAEALRARILGVTGPPRRPPADQR